MHHIVEGIRRFGPVYAAWMYPFERFNSWMCQRALNRAHPEITIMETYRVCIVYAHNPLHYMGYVRQGIYTITE